MSLWRSIAKKEIRLKTSRFRKNRKIFFISIYSLFLFWAFYIGPNFLDAILPEILKIVSGNLASFTTLLIEYSFATLFLMYIIYPLFILFRKSQIPYKEFLISSPIEPKDVFFGEFIGRLPFYFLIILGIGPFATTLLVQIYPSMNIFHYFIFYLSFLALSIFASLLGLIIANWLEYKIDFSKKLKKLGNYPLIVLSISVILFFFFIQFTLAFIRQHPEFKNYLSFYPSFWYSNIILYFINPVFIESYFLNIWSSTILATLVPCLFFYISYKNANKFYNIKVGIEKEQNIIYQEKKLYQIIRIITSTKYENLVVIQCKEFLRKKNSFIKLVYIIGLTTISGILIKIFLESPIIKFEETIFGVPLILQIIVKKELIIIILSWMGGLIFGILMGMNSFLDSKELLYVYKKSPEGIKTLISSYLILMLYFLIFIDLILTFFFSFIFQLDILITLAFFITFLINSEVILTQATGIQCIRPLFEERRRNIFFNNYFVIVLQIVSLLSTLFILIPILPSSINPSSGLALIILINLGISLGIALLLLPLGIQRLNKTE